MFDQVFNLPMYSKFLSLVLIQKISEILNQETADLFACTKEILNGKLHFLCSVVSDVSHAAFKQK